MLFIVRAFTALFSCFLLYSCASNNNSSRSLLSSITPYRITVVQGNFISREDVEKLKINMSKEEVREILGTPLLEDMFHKDQWDYLFTYKRGDLTIVPIRRYTLKFVNNLLVKFSGDVLPSEEQLVAEIDGLHKTDLKKVIDQKTK